MVGEQYKFLLKMKTALLITPKRLIELKGQNLDCKWCGMNSQKFKLNQVNNVLKIGDTTAFRRIRKISCYDSYTPLISTQNLCNFVLFCCRSGKKKQFFDAIIVMNSRLLAGTDGRSTKS